MSADTITIIAFAAVIALTLVITALASRRSKDTSHHYVAGGEIKGWQNGFAITSDYISASALLGTTGLVALAGFSGFYIAASGLLAFLVVLLFIAEPLRNLGKYTMADALTSRFNARWVRSMAALSTIAITIPYMIAQLVGGGALIGLLTGVDYTVAVLVIGILMAVYITAGGMVATTWIQSVAAALLLGGIFVIVLLLLIRFTFNPFAIFDGAAAEIGSSALTPLGGTLEGLNSVSLTVAFTLGVAGLPHILIRFFTVPDAKAARTSVSVAIWAIAFAQSMILVMGFGAAVLVGQDAIVEADAAGNLALPLLAGALGGSVLVAFIAAAAFGAIISTVAGLVIAASGAFAHDFYNNVIRNGEATDRQQLWAARIMAVLVAAIAMILSLAVQNVNVVILASVPLVIAASANFPVIMLMLFWRRFNTSGAIIGMATGLVASVGLTMIGTTVMGENAIFPLENPGLVSVPLGFLGCYLGTVLSGTGAREERERGRQISYEEIQVRSNTGIRSIEESEEAASKSRT